jgi:hypothetical protein
MTSDFTFLPFLKYHIRVKKRLRLNILLKKTPTPPNGGAWFFYR